MKTRIIFLDDSSVSVVEVDENEDSSVVDSTPGNEESEVGGDSSIGDTSDTGGDGDASSMAVISSADRPLLTTPLDEYTVTEGLLLLCVIFGALAALLAFFKGR